MKDKDLDKLFQEASKKASFGDAAAGWNDMKTKLKGADRKSTRLNSSHPSRSRMPSSA